MTNLMIMSHSLTFSLRDSWDSNMCSSSELSISSSMPVIFPARSGYMCWMRGKSLSPSICFCSWGGAAASILAVSGSCPAMTTDCWGCTETMSPLEVYTQHIVQSTYYKVEHYKTKLMPFWLRLT